MPQRVGRANSAVDATCHSLNATPFARSKGGEQGEGGRDGAREKRAKEVLTSRTISLSIFIVTILLDRRGILAAGEGRKIKWTNEGWIYVYREH